MDARSLLSCSGQSTEPSLRQGSTNYQHSPRRRVGQLIHIKHPVPPYLIPGKTLYNWLLTQLSRKSTSESSSSSSSMVTQAAATAPPIDDVSPHSGSAAGGLASSPNGNGSEHNHEGHLITSLLDSLLVINVLQCVESPQPAGTATGDAAPALSSKFSVRRSDERPKCIHGPFQLDQSGDGWWSIECWDGEKSVHLIKCPFFLLPARTLFLSSSL